MNCSGYFRKVLDKAAVIVAKSDKRFDLFDIGRSGPRSNGFELVRISPDAFTANNMAEKFHFLFVEFTIHPWKF